MRAKNAGSRPERHQQQRMSSAGPSPGWQALNVRSVTEMQLIGEGLFQKNLIYVGIRAVSSLR
jgi:hypothetical protein